uniref:Uncharacterized protein n=1 Tax=Oryza meridionalis TaxID=40149 RepID=A0A0E0DCA8_9ORYZ
MPLLLIYNLIGATSICILYVLDKFALIFYLSLPSSSSLCPDLVFMLHSYLNPTAGDVFPLLPDWVDPSASAAPSWELGTPGSTVQVHLELVTKAVLATLGAEGGAGAQRRGEAAGEERQLDLGHRLRLLHHASTSLFLVSALLAAERD